MVLICVSFQKILLYYSRKKLVYLKKIDGRWSSFLFKAEAMVKSQGSEVVSLSIDAVGLNIIIFEKVDHFCHELASDASALQVRMNRDSRQMQVVENIVGNLIANQSAGLAYDA